MAGAKHENTACAGLSGRTTSEYPFMKKVCHQCQKGPTTECRKPFDTPGSDEKRMLRSSCASNGDENGISYTVSFDCLLVAHRVLERISEDAAFEPGGWGSGADDHGRCGTEDYLRGFLFGRGPRFIRSVRGNSGTGFASTPAILRSTKLQRVQRSAPCTAGIPWRRRESGQHCLMVGTGPEWLMPDSRMYF